MANENNSNIISRIDEWRKTIFPTASLYWCLRLLLASWLLWQHTCFILLLAKIEKTHYVRISYDPPIKLAVSSLPSYWYLANQFVR